MSPFRSICKRQFQTKRRLLSLQQLEARRVLAASLGWDGPGLGNAELTYYIANSPDSLSQAETNAAIETALAAWSRAAEITFTPTSQNGLRNSIDISFTNIDGVGGTLAQAYFPDDVTPPRIAGDVQFDISDAWEVGNSLGNRAFDLVYVAAHEIGHSLGLDHTNRVGSVLAPFVSPSQSFGSLATVDVAAVQTLYAAADGVATSETPVDETTVDETPTDETPTNNTDTDDTGDTDDNSFPRRLWRRGGNWHRWGGRLDAEAPEYNYVNPTDVNDDGNTSALDALTIINQLSRSSSGVSGEAIDIVGLCDTNGDGAISALDALTVINAMNQRSSAFITVLDDPDDTDAEETGDEVGETDEDPDDVHCHAHRHHHSGILNIGLLGKDAETLMTRFDTDGDAALSEDEVSERLLARFTDLQVNADADGGVSLDELDAFFAEQQADAVKTGGRLHHHHRSSDVIFASIGGAGNDRFTRVRR